MNTTTHFVVLPFNEFLAEHPMVFSMMLMMMGILTVIMLIACHACTQCMPCVKRVNTLKTIERHDHDDESWKPNMTYIEMVDL